MYHVTSADGTEIAYGREGSGPAVVLVVGAFGDRNEPVTAGLAAQLAADFTVYRYDRRGRGDSGDTAPYAVEREIEDLRAVVSAAGGEAMVFGGSSGAILALRADAAGVPITRLAAFEPPFVTDPERPPLPTEKELTDLVNSGRRDLAIEAFLTRGADMPADMVAGMRTQPFWPVMEAVAHTLAYDAAIVGEESVPVELLASVTAPTLVLVGTASPVRMQTAAVAVTEAVPGARSQTLEGQAHGQLDPAVLGEAVVAFFRAG
ncbi:alpha/beta fold hydrolase [Hamadaea tsunoensis]|uniref:alpha/beta fold hydrolase n=1 Tax=Hamadaea tsunoensis TaxID=53368 RepID=UPI000420617C|nr:alpha/beta hydrolase [Hamadaea tsunoensis]